MQKCAGKRAFSMQQWHRFFGGTVRNIPGFESKYTNGCTVGCEEARHITCMGSALRLYGLLWCEYGHVTRGYPGKRNNGSPPHGWGGGPEDYHRNTVDYQHFVSSDIRW
jgi:hypothetical protein